MTLPSDATAPEAPVTGWKRLEGPFWDGWDEGWRKGHETASEDARRNARGAIAWLVERACNEIAQAAEREGWPAWWQLGEQGVRAQGLLDAASTLLIYSGVTSDSLIASPYGVEGAYGLARFLRGLHACPTCGGHRGA